MCSRKDTPIINLCACSAHTEFALPVCFDLHHTDRSDDIWIYDI